MNTLYRMLEGSIVIAGLTTVLWCLLVVVAFGQANLPPLITSDPSFELQAQLGNPGQGDEICAINEAEPETHLICAPPVDDIADMWVPLVPGTVQVIRAVTKLGDTVSTPSRNSIEVTTIPLPPTLLEPAGH